MVLDKIINFAMSNILYLVAIGVVIYIIHEYFSFKKRIKFKPLNRSDIERKNMIERMKYNVSSQFKWLYRGKNLLGKITHYVETEMKENPKNIPIITMVIKPTLFKNWKIVNPFGKSQIIMVENNREVIQKTMIKAKDGFKLGNDLTITDSIGITNYFGIYHTLNDKEEKMVKNIRNLDVFKTDINNLASIYFVKSQEQSTYAPEYAHQLAMKEKELQIELAKKKGKMETI